MGAADQSAPDLTGARWCPAHTLVHVEMVLTCANGYSLPSDRCMMVGVFVAGLTPVGTRWAVPAVVVAVCAEAGGRRRLGMAASSIGLLVLLRHGQSTSNAARDFTGWLDSPLTAFGRRQAADAGRRLADADIRPDVVQTSLLARAIVSADLALAEVGRCWIPVCRSWRLNERHYGALTGTGKDMVRTEAGEQQYRIWRNSLRVAPPPMEPELLDTSRRDPRYAALPAELVPATESLGDVVDRLLPYWSDVLVPQLHEGLTVLVVAHGNSLCALASHLDQLGQRELTALRIPTGEPLQYHFTEGWRLICRGGEVSGGRHNTERADQLRPVPVRFESRSDSHATWADRAGKPEVTSQTCRSPVPQGNGAASRKGPLRNIGTESPGKGCWWAAVRRVLSVGCGHAGGVPHR